MCDLWCPFPVLSLQKNKSITHIHLWQSDIQKHETWCFHCSKIHLIDVNLMPGNHIMTFNMNNYTYIITSNYYYYQSRTAPAFYLLYFLSTQKEFSLLCMKNAIQTQLSLLCRVQLLMKENIALMSVHLDLCRMLWWRWSSCHSALWKTQLWNIACALNENQVG